MEQSTLENLFLGQLMEVANCLKKSDSVANETKQTICLFSIGNYHSVVNETKHLFI